MKILVVDNGTEQLDGLLQIASRHEAVVVKPEDLPGLDSGSYNAIILAGSYERAVADDPAGYAAQIELAQSGAVPLLGICLGFEVICHAFGVELAEAADKIQAAAKIFPTADGTRIFQGSDPILVGETRRWCVDELPKSLLKLATSDTGIEAIKHKTLPVYGLQLYPGDFTYSSDGKLVFANILQALGK